MNEGRGMRTTVVMATILLALTFIWRLMPADEAPSSTLNALSILSELAMLVGVVGMVPRILRSLPEGAPRGGWIFLLVVAVVSGVGIFCIRLAGGPRVELPPRTSTADTGLPHQMHEQLAALEKPSNKLATSRWLQTFVTQDPVKIRTLTRQDLREARALCLEMRECTDRILKVFAEASAKGVAHSTLSDQPGATRPETWQATQETYIATYDYLGLIEQHWDEWLANPFPTGTSDLKPWQLEIQRLVDAAGASSRQAGALLRGAAPTSVSGTDTATLRKQLQEFVDRFGKLNERLAATRWITLKENPTTEPTRTRQDLQDAREIFSQYYECADGAVKVIAQAESKGIDLTVFHSEKALARLPFWSALQQLYKAGLENLAVTEQHWEEWKAQPEAPDEKSMKPWQREMKRLNDVVNAKLKEARAASEVAATPAAKPSPAAAEVTGLAKELRDLIASWNTLLEKSLATRWAKIDFEDPAQKRTLTRRDFEEAGKLRREMSDYQERIVKALAQAKSQGIDVSAATEVANCLRPEFWRGYQDIDALRLKYRKLIDQHWDEWLTSPETVDANSKPWQREMKRLIDEIDVRRNQVKALMDSTPVVAAPSITPITPPPVPRAPSPPGNNFDQLALQTHMLPAVADYVTASKRLKETRWIKSPDANAYHPQKITRADLHDANEKLRDLIATIDKLRTDLDAEKLPVPVPERDYWRVRREMSIAFQQLTTLLEENWKEWHVSGIEPKTGEAKPWQKEALRLQAEIDKLKQNEQSSILL